ncbi:RDD family protein [Lacrimispora indolis]|uniref:RDD family protein n=1 Tax=Lacrimispora indolis TaxID=69825 RepID=UPI00045E6AA5|nr:RDD family protein [Lacrimispora indolis]MBE7718410.1 RDD family protein [Lacrimispora celerecrescens]
MKRFFATIIDYVIFSIIYTIIFSLYPVGIIMKYIDTVFQISDGWLVVYCILLFLYIFVQDYFFKGRSFGKKIVKLNLRYKKDTIGFAIKHSLLKILASGALWPIALIYYCIRHKMFYDGILEIEEIQ